MKCIVVAAVYFAFSLLFSASAAEFSLDASDSSNSFSWKIHANKVEKDTPIPHCFILVKFYPKTSDYELDSKCVNHTGSNIIFTGSSTQPVILTLNVINSFMVNNEVGKFFGSNNKLSSPGLNGINISFVIRPGQQSLSKLLKTIVESAGASSHSLWRSSDTRGDIREGKIIYRTGNDKSLAEAISVKTALSIFAGIDYDLIGSRYAINDIITVWPKSN
ncbi:MAG: hypothetical protein RIA63_12825 [Cyclobacteriaceae bacterium]